jgi:hypothetical protein
MSEARLRVRSANSAVSALQMIEGAAKRACDMLSEMEHLAEKAADDYCTAGDAVMLNEQFKKQARSVSELMRQIEAMSGGESDHDRLSRGVYTVADGKPDGGYSSLSEAVVRLDPETFDLTTDAKGALASFRELVRQLVEYRLSLSRQREPLEDLVESIQEQMTAKLGSHYQTVTEHFVVQIMAAFMSDGGGLARMQENLAPNTACLLLLN